MQKVGIAGIGAIGSVVARALIDGIDGYTLAALCDSDEARALENIGRDKADIPFTDFDGLVKDCDLIIEALPAASAADLLKKAIPAGKTVLLISSAALLIDPSLKKLGEGQIVIASGALAGLDGVRALRQMGIKQASIRSIKPPKALEGAPFILNNKIPLKEIEIPSEIFIGNALEAARAFPANVNVAASLTLASGLDPEKVRVSVVADPTARGNSHSITVTGEFSTITATVENMPDPYNPKSSALAAQSIIAWLYRQNDGISI